MLFRGILIALGLFCVSSGLCTTYFVSPAGNDANSGTSPGAAFATIQHASDIVVAGDSVIVLAGAYTGFNVATSGTSLNPIVFLGEPGAEITAPTFTMDGINVEGADYIEINGFVVNDQPRNGIRLVNADWCIVRNCTCDNNFERGIFTGFTDDILIENNVCSNSIDEHGIYVSNSSDRSVIRFNTCFGNNRGGIQINADLSQGGDGISTDPEIYGNVLFSNGLGGGAAINLDGVQGAFIYNNVLYNNHATGIALFQQDGGGPSVNAQIVHNTIVQAVDGRWCILLVDGASGAQIYNNILFNQHPWRGSIAADPDATPGLTSDYNLVVDSFSDMGDGVSIPLSDWQALGYDLNSALADPLALLFVDPASGDFHLLPGSQAVDNGNGLLALGVTTDIDGNLRPTGNDHDNGAYEEQSIVLALASPAENKQTGRSLVERYTVHARSGSLEIQGPLEGTEVQLMSVDGRALMTEQPDQTAIALPTAALPAGIYVVVILRENRILYRRVIVLL